MSRGFKKFLHAVKEFFKKIMFHTFPGYRIGKMNQREIASVKNTLMTELRQLDRKYEEMFWYQYKDRSETVLEAKQRYFYELPKAEGPMREWQLKLAWMLKRLKDICDENNIKFFLEGGSLLGAVRHKGFIPWDDDIDLNMMKEDMDILKEALKDDEIFSFRYKYNYYLGCIVPGIELKDGSEGWIDIFPMVTIGCTKYDRSDLEHEINTRSKAMRKYLRDHLPLPADGNCLIDMSETDNSDVQLVMKTMDEYIEKIHNELSDTEEQIYCYRSIVAHNSPGGCNVFYLKDIVPFSTETFENTEYYVPHDPTNWLSTYYGDFYHITLWKQGKHFSEKDIKKKLPDKEAAEDAEDAKEAKEAKEAEEVKEVKETEGVKEDINTQE